MFPILIYVRFFASMLEKLIKNFLTNRFVKFEFVSASYGHPNIVSKRHISPHILLHSPVFSSSTVFMIRCVLFDCTWKKCAAYNWTHYKLLDIASEQNDTNKQLESNTKKMIIRRLKTNDSVEKITSDLFYVVRDFVDRLLNIRLDYQMKCYAMRNWDAHHNGVETW